MSNIEFTTWVEIPIRVFAEYQPEERATQTYPGCSAAVGIEDIEFDSFVSKKFESVKDYIITHCNDMLTTEAWDHLDQLNPEPEEY